VHYASFAAARSASVWIPAAVDDVDASAGGDADSANELPVSIGPGQPLVLTADVVRETGSRKLQKIWSAAVLGCTPLAPSRDPRDPAVLAGSGVAPTAAALLRAVQSVDPNAAANRRLEQRLLNQFSYAAANTEVELRFVDRSHLPRNGVFHSYNPPGHPTQPYVPFEVGWQDPVTATVRHRFALLPGPGRWLAAGLAGRSGRVERRDGVYQTTLAAATTMTIAGLQSLRPTVHPPERP
jgi:hypothetical protein